MRILVTGGTGFVGKRLCEKLIDGGHQVDVVSRSPSQAARGLPRECNAGKSAMAFIDTPPDAIVNLAGEPIAGKRWSDAQKKRLISSRVEATTALVEFCKALQKADKPLPAVMVSGSAMGYYGDQGQKKVDEETPPHPEFAHRLCAQWEAAAEPIKALGVRLAILRIGLVLDEGGGTLAKMLPPFKLGLGGRFGDGRQFMPWVHREDLVEAILYLINKSGLEGPFNAGAPHPVTNREFSQTLARHLNRPAIFPVPAFVLKAGLGEMSRLLLTGADMRPERLHAAGFNFGYPTLDKALADILDD
ncbi:TIGR01777 family oxidoreductase [Halomonas sp. PAMB 3232]|uniref:TIGR01777 family oxidoreductase n=1 Tax=Halomonas sp. PAMB 3232 TaxID=3075221 RepID=UPI0028A091AC|nr:TIGR01777 family oxidoreductase [Halomonas sp. PAMB 3232]WNL38809.1 TIGR01777 family oxidoreductase [Halomonas sp. PAMB 3232]